MSTSMVRTPSTHHRKHVSKAQAYKHASTQTRQAGKHVSTPSTQAHKHAHQAREHASTQTRKAREHASTPSTRFSGLKIYVKAIMREDYALRKKL